MTLTGNASTKSANYNLWVFSKQTPKNLIPYMKYKTSYTYLISSRPSRKIQLQVGYRKRYVKMKVQNPTTKHSHRIHVWIIYLHEVKHGHIQGEM